MIHVQNIGKWKPSRFPSDGKIALQDLRTAQDVRNALKRDSEFEGDLMSVMYVRDLVTIENKIACENRDGKIITVVSLPVDLGRQLIDYRGINVADRFHDKFVPYEWRGFTAEYKRQTKYVYEMSIDDLYSAVRAVRNANSESVLVSSYTEKAQGRMIAKYDVNVLYEGVRVATRFARRGEIVDFTQVGRNYIGIDRGSAMYKFAAMQIRTKRFAVYIGSIRMHSDQVFTIPCISIS